MRLSALLFLLLPLLTSCWSTRRPESCSNLGVDVGIPSDVYTIYPNVYWHGIKAYCDMATDKGGWTVFQRRRSGHVNFFRPWEDYRNGFGSVGGEHWLGLENLYQLTKDGCSELRVVLEDFEGNCVYAHYSSFSVTAESGGYALHVSGFKNGGAGDALAYHDGQKFSTFDNDQDQSNSNCARRYLGAFWYNTCYHANLNGIYQWGPVIDRYSNGIIWSLWKGNSYSVRTVTMMLRKTQAD